MRKRLWCALGVPEYKQRSAPASKLEPYKGYLKERVQEFPNLSTRWLLREIREQGYCGGYSTLARYVRSIRVSRPMPYELRFEADPGEQAQVDFAQFQAEFSVEPGRRRRQKRTILCVPSTNLQKFSTLGRFLVLTCLTLFITGFVPAAHAYQVITIIQAPDTVNEGDSFTFRVRRTGSAEDVANNYNFTTQFELKIATVNPIAGFNILPGGGATDSLEQTVTFNPGERDVWITVQTLENTLVNDDVLVRVTLKANTSSALQGNYLDVLVADDDGENVISIIKPPTSVDEGDSFKLQLHRTSSTTGDNYNESLQIVLKIAPVSPIAGFNILSGGGATDTVERTVTFNAGVRDVWITVETLDNTLVSDDITVRVTMKANTSARLQGVNANHLDVLVVDD